MALTRFLKGEFVNRLRNYKHFLEWFRSSDISEKMLRNSRYTSDSFREFAKCVDIKDIKPCSGWKRRLQLDALKIASDFAAEMEQNGIFFFACGGTLIGAIRHHGFIPWDDDMDFEMMHSDYDRMVDYCKKHHNVIYLCGKTEEEDFKQIDRICNEHKGEIVLIVGDKYSKLTIADTHVKRITIDFWPFEFIKEDTDFHTYVNYKEKIRNTGESLPMEERVEYYLQQEKVNPYVSRTPTSKIMGGVDMVTLDSRFMEDFIPSNYVFPLKKMQFEDKNVWTPANPDLFLKHHHMGDYMSYPKSYASYCLPTHEESYDIWFREHEMKAELLFFTEDELVSMLPLYNELRGKNVFALFINCNRDDIWGFIPDKYEVRWSAYRDLKSQYAVATKKVEELNNYEYEKIIFSGDTTKVVAKITSSCP